MPKTLLPQIEEFDYLVDNVEEGTDLWLQQIFKAGVALGEVDNIHEFLERVCKIGIVMGHCEGCSILSQEKGELRFLASLNVGMPGKEALTQFFSNFIIDNDNSSIVGFCANKKRIVSIEDVYNIEPNSEYSYNKKYDELNNYECHSILAIPMLDSKKNVLGVLELVNHIKDERITAFPEEMFEYLRVLSTQVGIVLKNLQTTAELKRSREETVMRFIKACESRDPETGGHVERIGRYSALIYQKLNFTPEECEIMRLSSMLHDIGKISIPDAILKKPGRLTPEEREVMMTHARAGYEILTGSESPMLEMGAQIALCHHEKWDGSGYPCGLSGENIPLVGRIVALVDVFDALSSKRCYKSAWSEEDVFKTLKDDTGTHFDPSIVKVFFDNIDEIKKIQDEISEIKVEVKQEIIPEKLAS